MEKERERETDGLTDKDNTQRGSLVSGETE